MTFSLDRLVSIRKHASHNSLRYILTWAELDALNKSGRHRHHIMNKVILIGFVGNDPTTATFNNGSKEKASFSVATSEKFNDKVFTSWHRIVAWNQLAKIVMNLLKKGSHVAIEGRIIYREVEKDGEKSYFTDIVADSVKLLDRAPKEDQPASSQVSEPSQASLKKDAKKGKGKTGKAEKPEVPVKEDDLPF